MEWAEPSSDWLENLLWEWLIKTHLFCLFCVYAQLTTVCFVSSQVFPFYFTRCGHSLLKLECDSLSRFKVVKRLLTLQQRGDQFEITPTYNWIEIDKVGEKSHITKWKLFMYPLSILCRHIHIIKWAESWRAWHLSLNNWQVETIEGALKFHKKCILLAAD